MAQGPESQTREQRLQAVLVAYLEAAERGVAPPVEELQARHPEFAGELAELAANHARLDRLAGPMRELLEAAQVEAASRRTIDSASTARATTPGPRIRYFGDYEILEELARGGMGVVYKARQISLNRVVAVKMILAGQLASAADVRRFRAEAEAAANLDHPNIVPIYEVGEHEGQHFFSMKLIDGGSLSTYAAHAEPRTVRNRPEREWARLLARVARAVHHAHQRGILHRDLKPGNILLDSDREPLVTDFGLARRVEGDSDLTQTGAIVGTPCYMAPEQARGEKGLSTAVDVYSLGAILYELLAGRPPFQAAMPLETVLQVLNQEPEPPSRWSPGCNRDLETICLKCLEKDPDRRYGSAEAFAEDLERWLAGEPIVARAITRLERARKWVKRKPAAAALVATSILAALALVGVLVGQVYSSQLKSALVDARQQRREADEQRQRVETLELGIRYDREVNMAHQALKDGTVARALDLLDNWQPARAPAEQADLRGWEWHYVRGLCTKELLTIRVSGGVSSMAFSADGGRLFTVDKTGNVKEWDMCSGREISAQPVPAVRGGDTVNGVELSNDGRLLLLRLKNRCAVWDIATARELLSVAGESAAMSADGRRFAHFDSNGTLKARELQSGREVGSFEGTGNLTFSPDGNRLVSASSVLNEPSRVRIWDLAGDREPVTLRGTQMIVPVAFSPDGKRLASFDLGTEFGILPRMGNVKLWDTRTGTETIVLPYPGYVPFRFSPDGKRLVLGNELGLVKIVDAVSGREAATLHANLLGGFDVKGEVRFSPDGQRLATMAPSGKNHAEIKIWDVTTAREARTMAIPHTGLNLAFSPDGQRIAVASMGSPQIATRHAVTGRRLQEYQGHKQAVTCVAFSADGRYLASGASELWRGKGEKAPGEAKLWDAVTGKEVRSLSGHSDGLKGVSFSPDSRWLATACQDGVVRIWEVETGKLIHTLAGHSDEIDRLTFSADGTRLATVGGKDSTVRIWDAASGTELHCLRAATAPHAPGVVRTTSAAFSPDGRYLASSHFVEIKHEKEKEEALAPNSGRMTFDAPQIQSGEITLWDLTTGTEVRTLRGHLERVMAVAFTPDGKRLVSAGEDRTVKFWDPLTGREVFTLSGLQVPVIDLAFSPDGRRLAAVGGNILGSDGELNIWDATPASVRQEEVVLPLLAQFAIDPLLAQGLGPVEMVAQLRKDTHLPAPIREQAVQLAALQEPDAWVLNDSAWNVIKLPGASPESYRMALRQAEAAVRRHDNANIRNTLGLAQYRAGDHQAALDTLLRATKERAAKGDNNNPWDLAFIAMSRHRLGQVERARKDLELLRTLPMEDAELQSFFREARALIAPETSKASVADTGGPRAEARATGHAYAADIAVAAEALHHKDSTSLDLSLQSVMNDYPDQHGFEWHYLWRQSHRERLTLPPMTLTSYDRCRVLFSPDGKLVANCKSVCDAASGKMLVEYEEIKDGQIFFSPDSRFLFAGWKVFDLSGNKVALEVPRAPNADAMPLGFLSADNAFLVLDRTAATLKSYVAATGKETVHEFQVRKGCRIVTASFSTKRALLAVAWAKPMGSSLWMENDEVEVWDLAKGGHKLFAFAKLTDKARWTNEDLQHLLFAPDGSTLVIATRDGRIRLCDPETGKERAGFDFDNGPRYLAFSRDSSVLLAIRMHDYRFKIWDVAGGKELIDKERTRSGYSEVVAALAPDGKSFATFDYSTGESGVVSLWDTRTGNLRTTFLGHRWPVRDLEYSPDGKVLAAVDARSMSPTTDATVKLWDTSDETTIGLPLDISAPTALAPSPDGKTVAISCDDGTVRLCEPATLKEFKRFAHQTRPVDILQFSPDGKLLAASHAGGEKDLNIDIWDVAGGKVVASFPGYLKGFDGKLLATIASVAPPRSSPQPPDTITLWDVATRARVVEVKDAHRKLFAMTRDGQVAATMVYAPKGDAGQCRLKVWNAATGQERLPDAFASRGMSPSLLKFSPDGKHLALGDDNLDAVLPSGTERTFPSAGRLFEVATGKERALFPLAAQMRDGIGGPQNNWTLAEFSADSKLLVTIAPNHAAPRSRLSFWDIETGKETGVLDNPEQLDILHAAFSPDGRTLATLTQGRWRREGTKIRIEKSDRSSSGLSGGSGGTTDMHPVCEIHLWDVATRQRRHRFVVAWYGWQVKVVFFGQDGQNLFTRVRHQDANIDRVQAWDVATGKERASLGDRGSRFEAIGFDADGQLRTISGQELNERVPELFEPGHKIRFWDPLLRKELAAPQVVTALDLPLRFDARLLTITPATPARGADAHLRASLTIVSDDEKIEATVSGNSIKLVERRTGKVLHLFKRYKQVVTRMAFSPDGKTLAVGDYDGTIRLWHVATGQVLMTLPGHSGQPGGVKDLAFRADGAMLASCSGTEIRLWRAAPDDAAVRRKR